MPKRVDHDERRRQVVGAVTRIAERRGLAAVSFREVAAEAGMSVALVQHYVDTKENLLLLTLDQTSARVAERIGARLAGLESDAGPFERLGTILEAFLPRDTDSRAAMLVYLQFAAAALVDPVLRDADAFANGRALTDVLAGELAEMATAGTLADGVEPETEARALVALVLGLSLGGLLEQSSPDEDRAVLRAHLDRLSRVRTPGRT